MPEKILVLGPVNGRFQELVAKVSAIQSKHGPFTALFVVGDLFHPDPTEGVLQQQSDLLDGKLSLPIATYFYLGTSSLPSQIAEKVEEARNKSSNDAPEGLVTVVQNLYYATGKSGIFTLPSGFRVAFLGGRWNSKAYAEAAEGMEEFDPEGWYESPTQRKQDEELPYITPATVYRLLAQSSFRLPSLISTPTIGSDARETRGGAKAGTLAAARASASLEASRTNAQSSALSLLHNRPTIDLLLTNIWPSGVTLFSTPTPSSTTSAGDWNGGLPDATARMWGSPAIARLASHGCPRYHFALAPSPSPFSSGKEDSDLPAGISQETLDNGAFWERPPYVTDLTCFLPTPLDLSQPSQRRQGERLKSVTRFVSLAKFANEKKRRWFLALNLTPASSQQESEAGGGKGVVVPGNATQTPYYTPPSNRSGVKRAQPASLGGVEGEEGVNYRFAEQRKRHRPEGGAEGGERGEVPPQGYVCRICGIEGHYIRSCPSKSTSNPSHTAPPSAPTDNHESKGWSKSTMPLPPGLPSKPSFITPNSHLPRSQLIPVGPSNCWFCLSNPNVAKQLIITINSDSYLVFPKGPFSHPNINRVPFSANHLLVVPLGHSSNFLPPSHPVLNHNRNGKAEEAEEEERKRVWQEMEETKQTIRKIWSKEKHAMLEWTLVRAKTSSRMTHFQTQLLALLSTVIDKYDLVKSLDDALLTTINSSASKILRNPSDITSYLKGTYTRDEEKGEEDGYFHMALHPLTGEKKEWLLSLTTSTRFPVQFVRHTLANLFGLGQLADWKTSLALNRGENREDKGEEVIEEEKKNSAGFRAMILSQSS